MISPNKLRLVIVIVRTGVRRSRRLHERVGRIGIVHHGRMVSCGAMYLGIVKGTVVADRKASGLEGKKILLVQPVDERGTSTGELQAAIDTVQAGVGDLVYLVGSREAALALDPWFVPVDAAIVGIVDGVQV
jgi:ethanolamine utilization protein EutN